MKRREASKGRVCFFEVNDADAKKLFTVHHIWIVNAARGGANNGENLFKKWSTKSHPFLCFFPRTPNEKKPKVWTLNDSILKRNIPEILLTK